MMDKMLTDMVSKMIPPELAEMLTAEKAKELSDGITVFVTDVRSRLERIEANQAVILTALGASNAQLLEAISNVGNNNRNKRRGNSGDAIGGSGSGDGDSGS